MVKSEYFDIYDRQRNWVGTAERSEVHAKGWWHQTFHCWIFKKEQDVTYLLFQRRHPDKDTFPNLLDISCAGHLEAGETVADGVRELAEELGLQVTLNELTACGVYAEEDKLPGGGMDREYCHIFIYPCDRELKDYQVQLEEVSGLYWVALADVIAMVEGRIEQIPACGMDISEQGIRSELASYSFSVHEFVPHDREYYQFVFAQLQEK